MLLSFIKPFDD